MKKIYYFPGLISAVLIPVLFWYYGNQRVQPQYTIVDLGLPAKHIFNPEIDNTFEPYRNWKYKQIVVKPNTALRNQKYYISELKKLQERNQKETGIEFVIDDHNNYQDFIALIDAMKLADQDSYGVDMDKTNHFFALHFYKDPNGVEKIHRMDCGTRDATVFYRIDHHYKGIEKFKYLLDLPKQAYYIIFGFLVFLNISMFSIKENLQIQRKTFA
ncbi:hypothetical protein EG346_23690 [Chryseobacterium carnipullorum]|uniref:Uncharacterized protein n=1 Tax=Chryseobacterium carnipullorum TaxID=1124835 RepID=A0A376E712_CHRCU|nr:hypothetical protein [Chryseobacterium carnipullorum]AZA51471.1 hypothetical protein EG346_23690 [Chryseobacterium carnipullorum]AZA67786.1 hypothetical protein EG345_14795 [Chryseobacterium carnipullorum]STD03637.1 Uncharacterised protein [Chryseobacterium carnipullorum]